jgi:hypothetical protein
MRLFGIETDKGNEVHSFECPACRHIEVRTETSHPDGGDGAAP